MQVFLLPAGMLAIAFWGGMLVTYYFLRFRINNLAKRVKRLERQVGGTTEDFRAGHPVQPPQPRPHVPSRYVTVDRELRW